MIRRIISTILCFLLFYTPPILGQRSLRILIVVSLAYILINIKYVIRFTSNVRFFLQYAIWSVIIIYIWIVGHASGNGANYLAGQIYWLISVVPTCIVISCLIQKEGQGIKGLLDCSLMAAFAQSIIAIVAFLSPSIKQVLISSMIQGHIFEEQTYTYELLYRLFGYSGGLTFGMPALQSFLAMIALYLTVNYKPKYFFFVPFLSFSAIINARTSFVIMIVCGIVIIFQRNKDNIKKAFRILILAVLAVGVLAVIIPVLENIAPDTFNWVRRGVNELLFASRGNLDQGYFSYLTNSNKWVFPDGLGALFGYGIRVMGNNKYGSATDVGFVNDIWFGGLLYLLIAYALFFFYCKRIRSIDVHQLKYPDDMKINGIGKYLFASFLITAFFLNFKTYIIDIHSLSMLFILILVYADLFDSYVTGNTLDNVHSKKHKGIKIVFKRKL